MNGLPEPMAPVVPDLHSTVAPAVLNTTRTAQANTASVTAAPAAHVPAAGPRVVAPSTAHVSLPPSSATHYNATAPAKPANQHKVTAPSNDVQMKDRSRPSVNMPSVDDVRSALSGIELAKQVPTDPQEINKRFMELMARHPMPAEAVKAIDGAMLWLNCPPPLIQPRSPEKRRRSRYTLAAYSSHAPPSATRFVPQHKQTVLDHPHSGANIKRYLRMGKPPNPQFTYHPPSRPASRATSAGVAIHRSRSPPVKNVGTGGSAEQLTDIAADDHQTVRKRCGCCMQDFDFRTGMSKLRYCPRCEKMRWQLRQNGGGRVQHLRDAIQELGHSANVQDVVSLAANKAQLSEKAAPLAAVSAAAPAAVMTLAQGPTVESLAQEERDARAPGSGRASGSGTEEHPERRSKPEKPARAERSQPALNTFKSTEEIDNMAALLAGKSLDKDDRPQQPPQKRAAVIVQKDCDICRQPFAWKSDTSSSCCEFCEQLKSRTKSAGYTTSELRKGIATGFIIPQTLPSAEDIRRLLGNMMLGRPRDAAPPGRAGRRPARDRSTPTPTTDSKPSDGGLSGAALSRDGSVQQSTQAAVVAAAAVPNVGSNNEVKEEPYITRMDAT